MVVAWNNTVSLYVMMQSWSIWCYLTFRSLIISFIVVRSRPCTSVTSSWPTIYENLIWQIQQSSLVISVNSLSNMMSNLQHRNDVINQHRSQNSWKDFVMDVASRYNLSIYTNQWLTSRFPDTDRCGQIVPTSEYLERFRDGCDAVRTTNTQWYEKVDEIFWQMEQDGTLWEFFPASMNPFYFNDTAAYLIDPSFTKEEVTARWYLWRDEPVKVDIPIGAMLVSTDELDQYEWWHHPEWIEDTIKERILQWSTVNQDITDTSLRPEWQNEGTLQEKERYIDPNIMKKIIQDPEWNVYRIVPMEYEFLMKYWLPLPRKHWLERMRENFKIH